MSVLIVGQPSTMSMGVRSQQTTRKTVHGPYYDVQLPSARMKSLLKQFAVNVNERGQPVLDRQVKDNQILTRPDQ